MYQKIFFKFSLEELTSIKCWLQLEISNKKIASKLGRREALNLYILYVCTLYTVLYIFHVCGLVFELQGQFMKNIFPRTISEKGNLRS